MVQKVSQLIVALVGTLLSATLYAGNLEIEGAWARATAPGQDTAMMDFSITSKQPARLTGFSSPVSKSVELHRMTHDNGMMKMREVDSLELAAGQRVNLGEQGYHLMLIGLKMPLKAGTSVPLTIDVKLANQRTVKFKTHARVRPLIDTNSEKPVDGQMPHHEH